MKLSLCRAFLEGMGLGVRSVRPLQTESTMLRRAKMQAMVLSSRGRGKISKCTTLIAELSTFGTSRICRAWFRLTTLLQVGLSLKSLG